MLLAFFFLKVKGMRGKVLAEIVGQLKKEKEKENGLVYGDSVSVLLNNLVSASDGGKEVEQVIKFLYLIRTINSHRQSVESNRRRGCHD